MIKKIIIFAGSDLPEADRINDAARGYDLVICADGGVRNAEISGFAPDILVGDFDSIEPGTLERYSGTRVKIISFPPEKDKSDLEIALDLAATYKPGEIIILGALGGRVDHTLFNLSLLFNSSFQSSFQNTEIKIIGKNEKIFAAKKRTIINEPVGTLISLVPFSSQVKCIKLDGFKFPLEGEDLLLGSSRGLSNVIAETPAAIEFESGMLLVIINWGGVEVEAF
jgi:thiamine pyrophosphokinase